LFKRILAFILALVMCGALIACDAKDSKDKESKETTADQTPTQAPTQAPTTPSGPKVVPPEEVVEKFACAMLTGDLDGFLADVPDFVYDFMANMPDVELEPGGDKVEAVRDYFEKVMAAEPEDIATEVTVKTMISNKQTDEDYIKIVHTYYIPEGVLTQKQLEEIECIVYVAFNYTAKFADGSEKTTKDWETAVPCLKIDGKWYVDLIYLFMLPVQAEPAPMPN